MPLPKSIRGLLRRREAHNVCLDPCWCQEERYPAGLRRPAKGGKPIRAYPMYTVHTKIRPYDASVRHQQIQTPETRLYRPCTRSPPSLSVGATQTSSGCIRPFDEQSRGGCTACSGQEHVRSLRPGIRSAAAHGPARYVDSKIAKHPVLHKDTDLKMFWRAIPSR